MLCKLWLWINSVLHWSKVGKEDYLFSWITACIGNVIGLRDVATNRLYREAQNCLQKFQAKPNFTKPGAYNLVPPCIRARARHKWDVRQVQRWQRNRMTKLVGRFFFLTPYIFEINISLHSWIYHSFTKLFAQLDVIAPLIGKVSSWMCLAPPLLVLLRLGLSYRHFLVNLVISLSAYLTSGIWQLWLQNSRHHWHM